MGDQGFPTQWVTVYWRCRGHGLKPWSGRIPRAAEHVSPRATMTEAPVPRVCALQQEKTISHAHSHEKPAPQLGNSPCWPQLEKAHAAVETQHNHK